MLALMIGFILEGGLVFASTLLVASLIEQRAPNTALLYELVVEELYA